MQLYFTFGSATNYGGYTGTFACSNLVAFTGKL